MDLRKLEIFAKIVEEKSFSRAAEALGLSQPTVSEHMRGLEAELGQSLLDRLGRSVEPTTAGRLLYDYAKRLQNLHQEAVLALQRHTSELRGTLAVGGGTIPGTYVLPGLLACFKRRHPEIQAQLRIAGSRTIAAEVQDGRLELGLIGASWREQGLVWEELFRDELVVIAAPDHPLLERAPVSVPELLEWEFVLREPESGTRKVMEQRLAEHGVRRGRLTAVAEIGSTAAVKEAVKAGIGISVVSRRAVAEELRHGLLGVVAVDTEQWQRPFYLVWRKHRELSPLARTFVAFLRERAETGCA